MPLRETFNERKAEARAHHAAARLIAAHERLFQALDIFRLHAIARVEHINVDHRRLATVAIAAASGLLITAQMAIHLGIERAFGQALLQRIQQSAPTSAGDDRMSQA